MRFLLWAWVVSLSSLSWANAAQQRIVLFTSIDPSGLKLPWYLKFKQDYYLNYEKKLESTFQKFFSSSSNYEFLIRHRASQADLWEALHHPRTVAIFWISHSGGAQSGTCSAPSGVASRGMILDSEGFDISPILMETHPNLRFIGLVGCSSLHVVERMGIRSMLASRPGLRILGFHDKIDAREGLKTALSTGFQIIRKPGTYFGYSSPCLTEKGIPVHVKRVLPRAVSIEGSCDSPQTQRPAVRIETRTGMILGIFPKACAHRAHQSLHFHIPESLLKEGRFPNLQVSAGQNFGLHTPETLTLGDFEWSTPYAQWSLWKNKKGIPIGVTSHLYQAQTIKPSLESSFEGEVADFQPGDGLEDYNPFACEPMPSAANQ